MRTPMADGGARVDPEAAGRLAGWLVDKGVHGLYVAGTTGEGLYLSPEEHRELVQAVVKAAKGTPVVAHVGALTTAQAVALARQAVGADATAVAAIPPPYYSLSRDELLAYFSSIANAAEPLPLYLYNIPSCARNELPPTFVAECARAIPSVRGIKDSSGAVGRIPELVKTLGPGYDVVCGNDDRVLHAFQVGAAGIVASGASLFPELYLARIIHEGFVNNPGLPEKQPSPPAAGGYVVAGGNREVSPCAGDDRSVPDRRPHGVLFSLHCSRAVFANNAG